jgi:hypothetical protein
MDLSTESQLETIIDGNRHTDYPLELLVHLDNGVAAYIDALLSYHEGPGNQAPHFLLRADNWGWDAWQEALCVIENKTVEGAALWPNEPIAALTKIGSATHTLQDSYALAHTVRCDPGKTNEELNIPDDIDCTENPWCLVKLKTFVYRTGVFAEAHEDPDAPDHGMDIEYHERHDYSVLPGHAVAGDAIFWDRLECHEPAKKDVLDCLLPNAARAVVSTRAYLTVVWSLLDSGAGEQAIRDALDTYFAQHMQLCRPLPEDRPPCPKPE